MKGNYLGEFEELVLLIVAMLEGDAYGVSITHEIVNHADRDVRLNQVHASLQRLEDKGLVRSRMSDPTPARGGRRKRLFSITAYGKQTLVDIQNTRMNIWKQLPSSIRLNLAKS